MNENLFDTRIPGYIRIPQIPDSHYCPDARIHLPGYKPGYYPPARVWCMPSHASMCFKMLA